MKEIQFVNAENLNTLEEYGAALLSSMISLRTLESFHVVAFNKGLLQEDEAKVAESMLYDIRRLLKLYQTQMENILDRTELSEQEILDSLRRMMPDVKVPRKRKYAEKAKDKD